MGEKIGFKPLIGRAKGTTGFQFRQKNGVVNGIKCKGLTRMRAYFT